MEVSEVKLRTGAQVGLENPPKLDKDAKSEEEALAHYRRVPDEICGFVEQLPQIITNVR